MMESPLTVLSRTIYDFMDALRNYERFSERELNEFIIQIENTVDVILSQYKMTSITDARFRVLNDALREYETVIKTIKDAMLERDYSSVRAQLPELERTVRRLSRLMSVVATGGAKQIVEASKEFDLFIGETIHEYDDRIKELSHVARVILAQLVDSPMRELNLREIPRKIGMTDKDAKKQVSDAVGELLRKIPDLVEVVPDTRLGGLKLRWKR